MPLPDGRRKSIQPMAERLPNGNMMALQQFVNQLPWDPLPVRRRIAERSCQAIAPQAWLVDEVSFPKCGTASVGVAGSTASVGQAGELPGRGQRARGRRHRIVPAGVGAVPARGTGGR
nr:transposase [Streptomyces sp. MC1]